MDQVALMCALTVALAMVFYTATMEY